MTLFPFDCIKTLSINMHPSTTAAPAATVALAVGVPMLEGEGEGGAGEVGGDRLFSLLIEKL